MKAKDKTTDMFIDFMTKELKEIMSKKLSELKDGFNLSHSETTISGWVAVDDFDNAYIYHSKPTQKCREFCDTGDYITDWDSDTNYPNGKSCYLIDKDIFPNLTSDSEPIEVEITIKPKKK